MFLISCTFEKDFYKTFYFLRNIMGHYKRYHDFSYSNTDKYYNLIHEKTYQLKYYDSIFEEKFPSFYLIFEPDFKYLTDKLTPELKTKLQKHFMLNILKMRFCYSERQLHDIL